MIRASATLTVLAAFSVAAALAAVTLAMAAQATLEQAAHMVGQLPRALPTELRLVVFGLCVIAEMAALVSMLMSRSRRRGPVVPADVVFAAVAGVAAVVLGWYS